jgi:hypothetical protein
LTLHPVPTSIGCDLFWSQWLVAHPLKDSHLFPLSRALHLLLINRSPAGDLVCHPLILLRLPQPLALLRLKLEPSSAKSASVTRLQLS